MPANKKEAVNTGGGASVGEGVSVNGGDFVGRDKIVIQPSPSSNPWPLILTIALLIIVLSAGLITAVILLQPHSFDYQARIETKTGAPILYATVRLEIGGGKAPLDSVSDSAGLARIFIDASYAGKPGRLIVEATGYKKYTQNIDLTEGDLPKVIQLDPNP